jgi:sulfoxide reductase heme-binding subunit YedZ
MTSKGRPNRMLYLALVGVAALIVAAILLWLNPPYSAGNALARGAALLGYFAIWLAILSSYYLRELTRFFGQPFIKVHHALSIAGLAWITIHPLAVAWDYGTLRVLAPDFSSWSTFWRLAGRPAWYLLILGASAAWLRKAIGQNWRALHAVMYVAFILGTVHGILLSAPRYPLLRVLWAVMALAVVVVFALKRAQAARRKKPRPA